MPAKLDPEQKRPRKDGNVQSFDEDHDRYGIPVGIHEKAGRLIQIMGTFDDDPEKVYRYHIHDGVFGLFNDKREVVKRGEYDGPIESIAIGRRYGEISNVTSIKIHDAPPHGERDQVHEIGTHAVDRLRERMLKVRGQLGRLSGEHCIEMKPPLPETEQFRPSKAVNLRFLNANLHVTGYENFNPIVATTRELPWPPELHAYFAREQKRHAKGGVNYATEKRTERRRMHEDTRKMMVEKVAQFLSQDPRGRNICQAMGIEPLSILKLSPKQTIELIGQVLHETTNYDYSAIHGYNRADDMDALSILEHGLSKRSKQDVTALGVCRNYSALGHEMFYSFKTFNRRLVNTHCFNSSGYGGATTGGTGNGAVGHAWLDFVMVADEGELIATTVDPTWTKKSVDGKLHEFDQTDARLGTHVRTITAAQKANVSDRKDYNAQVVQQHYEKGIKKSVQKLVKRYGGPSGLSLDAVPNDDPRLQQAVFGAIELGIFAETVGGGSRMELHENVKRLIARSADTDHDHYTAMELYIVLRQVVEDAENATTLGPRSRAFDRLRNLEAVSRGMKDWVSSHNDGVDVGNMTFEYGMGRRIEALVGNVSCYNLVRNFLKQG